MGQKQTNPTKQPKEIRLQTQKELTNKVFGNTTAQLLNEERVIIIGGFDDRRSIHEWNHKTNEMTRV